MSVTLLANFGYTDSGERDATKDKAMKIGIIGSGNIGGALGRHWTAKGHDVVFGARDPNSPKVRAALAEASGARVASPDEAAAFGEVVVLAIPWTAVRDTLPALGNLNGKIIIDPTNRMASGPGDAPSAAEDIQRLVLGAHVVKAFNTIAAEVLAQPHFDTGKVTTFICGDSAEARTTVIALANDVGLDAVDAGTLANAPLVESLTRLYMVLARNYGRQIAFSLLRR